MVPALGRMQWGIHPLSPTINLGTTASLEMARAWAPVNGVLTPLLKIGALTSTPGTGSITPLYDSVLGLSAYRVDNAYWTVADPLTAQASWSWTMWFHPTAWGTDNPGLSRTNTGTGSTFCIFQGATGRPWIRVSGTDVLLPGSGNAMSLNQTHHIAFVWRNGAGADFYLNGRLAHTASTAATQSGTDSWNQLGTNAGSASNGSAKYGLITYHTRALTHAEVWRLYAPESRGYVFDTLPLRTFVSLASGGGGSTRRISAGMVL